MQAALSETMEARPLDAALGAEIRGVDLAKPLDGRTKDAVLAAWHAHGALLIRNQKITDPQLIEFSRLFGDLRCSAKQVGLALDQGLSGTGLHLEHNRERPVDRQPR